MYGTPIRAPKPAIIRNDGVGGSNPSCGTINLGNSDMELSRQFPKAGGKFFSVLDTILPPSSKEVHALALGAFFPGNERSCASASPGDAVGTFVVRGQVPCAFQ
jgi:hypothetical protein